MYHSYLLDLAFLIIIGDEWEELMESFYILHCGLILSLEMVCALAAIIVSITQLQSSSNVDENIS